MCSTSLRCTGARWWVSQLRGSLLCEALLGHSFFWACTVTGTLFNYFMCWTIFVSSVLLSVTPTGLGAYILESLPPAIASSISQTIFYWLGHFEAILLCFKELIVYLPYSLLTPWGSCFYGALVIILGFIGTFGDIDKNKIAILCVNEG